MKILEQRLRHHMSGTSTYSHMYDDHDDSRNTVSSRDAEVDGFGQGSENSTTRRRVAVVIPISYAARARLVHQEVVGGGRGGGIVGCVVYLLLLGPPFI
jgi:hypothetical protein